MSRRIQPILFLFLLVFPSCAVASGSISGDIFGKNAGIYHPFLSLTEAYSTNLYKTEDNSEGDLTSILSPGIWFSLPRTREKKLQVETSNTAPGGLSLSRTKPDISRRYQSYLLLTSDMKINAEYDDADVLNYKADGFLQFNLRSGLSFDLIDQMRAGHEPYGLGVSDRQDPYTSNLFQLLVSYDITQKIAARLDYSHFLLQYDDSRVTFADRADNRFSGYLFYRIKSKTALFGEIEYTAISYDTSSADSKELRYFLGVDWNITAKSKGTFKLGAGSKKFANQNFTQGDGSDMALELKLEHRFTPKTSLKVTGMRRTEETTVEGTYYSLVNSISMEYLQVMNEKIAVNSQFLYANEQYEGAVNYSGTGLQERKDNKVGFSVGLRYAFRQWLTSEAAYIYNIRSSNIDGEGYNDHTIVLNLTAAL